MRIPVLIAIAGFALPAAAQVPQLGMGSQGPTGAAAVTSTPSVTAPAPVPAVPPALPGNGPPHVVPEKIAPPGSGGTAGPGNNTPFSGPPAQTLSPGGTKGQTDVVPKLTR